MAFSFLFTPKSMTAAQYDDCIAKLQKAGAGSPKGRLYHACFGEGNKMRVFDIWESMESFERFGQTLMPILQQLGVDPGQPEIQKLHGVIQP